MTTAPNRALPEMTGTLATRLDRSGIKSMDARERAAQPVGIGRHQDEMYVVRHQTPGPHLDAGRAAMGGEQIAIKRIVSVAEEGLRAAVAALDHVMRMIGDDDAGETGHAASCLSHRSESIECTVAVIARSRKTKHDNTSWQPHCHRNYLCLTLVKSVERSWHHSALHLLRQQMQDLGI